MHKLSFANLCQLIPQIVAVVATGVLLQVILMIFFSRVKDRRFSDFGNDRTFPFSGFIHLHFDPLSNLLLFVVGIENSRSILGADIIFLLVNCSGIVHAEKEAKQLSKT